MTHNPYNPYQARYSGYDPAQDPILEGMGVTDEAGSGGVEEQEGGGNFDPEAWGNGLGSVLDGVGGLLAGIGVGNGANNQVALPNTPSGDNEPKTTDKKPNYMMWLIILVVIILLIVGFFMLRKGKAAQVAS